MLLEHTHEIFYYAPHSVFFCVVKGKTKQNVFEEIPTCSGITKKQLLV